MAGGRRTARAARGGARAAIPPTPAAPTRPSSPFAPQPTPNPPQPVNNKCVQRKGVEGGGRGVGSRAWRRVTPAHAAGAARWGRAPNDLVEPRPAGLLPGPHSGRGPPCQPPCLRRSWLCGRGGVLEARARRAPALAPPTARAGQWRRWAARGPPPIPLWCFAPLTSPHRALRCELKARVARHGGPVVSWPQSLGRPAGVPAARPPPPRPPARPTAPLVFSRDAWPGPGRRRDGGARSRAAWW